VGQGFLIIEDSRSYSDTPHSVGLLLADDQPNGKISAWKHTILLRDIIHALAGIRTHNSSKRMAKDLRLRPRDLCERVLNN